MNTQHDFPLPEAATEALEEVREQVTSGRFYNNAVDFVRTNPLEVLALAGFIGTVVWMLTKAPEAVQKRPFKMPLWGCR